MQDTTFVPIAGNENEADVPAASISPVPQGSDTTGDATNTQEERQTADV